MAKRVLTRRGARLAVGSILLIGAVLLAPSAALAGKASAGTAAIFAAYSGEANNVAITDSSSPLVLPGQSVVAFKDNGVAPDLGGSNCEVVGSGAVCRSNQNKVEVNLKNGNDTATGHGTSAYTLNGGDDNDTLTGSTGRDTLNGNSHDDVLDGGAEEDKLNGGGGDDVIHAGDGEVDAINCGTGYDIVYADVGFDDIDNNCEEVHAPALPEEPEAPEEDLWEYPEANDSDVEFDEFGYCAGGEAVGRSAKVSKRRLKIKIKAPGSTAKCSGTLRLDTAIVRPGSKKVKKVKLGQARYEFDGKRTVKVKVKLSKRGAKVVNRFKRVAARLTVYTDPDAGASTSTYTSKTFTLKAKKAKRKR